MKRSRFHTPSGEFRATPTSPWRAIPHCHFVRDENMVARGSLGTYKPGKPSPAMYSTLLVALIVFSLGGGYLAGIQPIGEWRYFSWHPMLMTVGMVGLAGTGAATKKLGGYSNTKIHGYLSWASIFCSLGGLYVIYSNKNANGYQHLQSPHAWAGLILFLSCVLLGTVGGVFLHPDFGIDKGNKTIRFWHKTGARLVLIFAWVTAILGLQQLVKSDIATLMMYSLPLFALVPFVLM